MCVFIDLNDVLIVSPVSSTKYRVGNVPVDVNRPGCPATHYHFRDHYEDVCVHDHVFMCSSVHVCVLYHVCGDVHMSGDVTSWRVRRQLWVF